VQSQQGEMESGRTDEWFALLASVAVAASVVTARITCLRCEAGLHAPVRIEKEIDRRVQASLFRDTSVLGCVRTTRELPATTTVLWGACNFSGTFRTRLWDY
jgi:hypothetical protein